ncbi:MAG TPA: PAS domain S-box protein [Pyrinomonadaceae bacterium]|nr:PAS domain S-box protein [Pyrinomonadaceae bacterium]
MKIRFHHIIIVLGLISLMTFLYFKTNSIDSESHNRFNNQLRYLKELNATVDKDILESRYGLSNSYDALISEISKINELQTTIKDIPAFLDENGQQELDQSLEKYFEFQKQKILLIERFKSRNAIINNSLRYFPIATSNLIKNLGSDNTKTNQAEQLNYLLRQTLSYYLLTDNELEPQIVNQIKELQKLENKLSEREKADIEPAISHAQTIVKLKPEIDSLVKETLSIPIPAQTENLINIYNSYYNRALSRANIYRLFLYIFSILLLGYIGLIIIKLKKATSALNTANETLENRVQQRTEELLWSNSELQKSEANNHALLHAIPDSMWRTDKDGVFLDLICAKGEETMFSGIDWCGKTIFDVLPDHVARQTIQFAEKSLKTGETQIFEYELNQGDKVQHYESRVVVCGESEILTIVRNISDRKQTEERQAAILDALPAHICLLDPSGKILEVNNEWKQFAVANAYGNDNFGIGSNYIETCENASGDCVDGARQAADICRAVLSGKTSHVEMEYPCHSPNEQRWFKLTVNPLHKEKLVGAVVMHVNITQRKMAEEAAQNSRDYLDQIINAIADPIFVKNRQHQLTLINDAMSRFMGRSREEAIGTVEHDLFPANEADVFWKIDELIFTSGKENINEEHFTNSQGNTSVVVTRKRLHIDKEGNEYIVGIFSDITERKLLEDQLQRAQKLESIGQLAAGIAHEINTPTQYVGDNTRFLEESFQSFITVVEKNRELLKACQSNKLLPELTAQTEELFKTEDIEYLEEEVPRAIEQALHGVERISKIVQSMKDFAHPGSDEKKATNLNKTIESTITIARNEWKYVAEMVTNYDQNLPPVPCLVGEFNQVILNMIVNASHAIADVVGTTTNKKGTISVTTKNMDNWAEIRISDTGTGITPDVRKRIFDPFFTTKEVGRGSGQGLAISHTVIVEKHKGTIDIESEIGKGSTFIIRLPINEPELKSE